MTPPPRRRLWAWGPVVLWCGLLFAASCIPAGKMPQSPVLAHDKLIHGGVYLVLGALVMRALRRYFLAVALVAAYGLTDELHQLFTPGRDCDVWDWAVDVAGAAVGAAIVLALLRVLGRKRGAR